MALDVISNILLNVKADTKQAKKALKDLSTEEKKLAKDFIETQEARNAKIDKQIAILGKLALGVGAVVGAYKTLSAAAEAYGQRQRLVSASAGISISAIQDASRGLITETEALKIAAASQNTAWKISQSQLETVAKAMVSLRNQGNDFAEVQEKVTKAIVEGNVEALRPFGIILQGATGKAETFQKVMAALAEEAGKVSASIEIAGDAADQTRVRMTDLWDKVVDGAGKAALAIGEFAVNVVEGFDILSSAIAGVGDQDENTDQLRMMRARMAARANAARADAAVRAGTRIDRPEQALAKAADAIEKDIKDRKQERKRPIDVSVLTVEQQMRVDSLLAVSASLPTIGAPSGGGAIEAAAASLDMSIIDTAPIAQVEDMTDALMNMGDTAATAFGIFEGASSRAFQTFIDGSASMRDIAKNLVGDILRGIAAEMFARALFHGAAAIGSLASGNFAAAGAHGKAAGLYAGGAVAVGVVARQFGGHSDVGSRGGAPAAAVGAGVGGGTSSDGGRSQTFIVVQDQFDDDPRAARRRLKRAFDRAQGEYRGSPAVVRS